MDVEGVGRLVHIVESCIAWQKHMALSRHKARWN